MKMSLMRNVFLYLIRKKSISLILLLIFTAVFTFLQLGISLQSAASEEKDSISRSLGSSFTVKTVIDYNDESLWTEKAVAADGTTLTKLAKNALIAKQMATTTLVRPVRPPAPMPAALST